MHCCLTLLLSLLPCSRTQALTFQALSSTGRCLIHAHSCATWATTESQGQSAHFTAAGEHWTLEQCVVIVSISQRRSWKLKQ